MIAYFDNFKSIEKKNIMCILLVLEDYKSKSNDWKINKVFSYYNTRLDNKNTYFFILIYYY